MKYIRILLVLLFLILIYAVWYQRNHCEILGYSPCKVEAANWKASAPLVLQDYKAMQQEISSNNLMELSGGFIKESDLANLSRIKKLPLSNLTTWFKKYPTGWISSRNGILELSYGNCYWGRCGSNAYLYHNTNGIQPDFTKNLIADITDSVSLGNDWYYISTQCLGCGE